jgi:serine/threonine-protein kinase HipA
VTAPAPSWWCPPVTEPPAVVAEAEPIDDDALATLLRALPDRPLGDDDEVRVSLAGQQSKLLLARRADGRWLRPLAGTPSTHILKPADQRYPDAAANEVLCLRLARGLGLTRSTPNCWTWTGSRWSSSPATTGVSETAGRAAPPGGRLPGAGRRRRPSRCGKYQGARRPRLRRGRAPARRPQRRPGPDGRLLEVATFTVAIGNADAHGKNLSLLLPPLDDYLDEWFALQRTRVEPSTWDSYDTVAARLPAPHLGQPRSTR